MAKEIVNMEEFKLLDYAEQQKILKKLEKVKKTKPVGAPEKEDTGATEGWE